MQRITIESIPSLDQNILLEVIRYHQDPEVVRLTLERYIEDQLKRTSDYRDRESFLKTLKGLGMLERLAPRLQTAWKERKNACGLADLFTITENHKEAVAQTLVTLLETESLKVEIYESLAAAYKELPNEIRICAGKKEVESYVEEGRTGGVWRITYSENYPREVREYAKERKQDSLLRELFRGSTNAKDQLGRILQEDYDDQTKQFALTAAFRKEKIWSYQELAKLLEVKGLPEIARSEITRKLAEEAEGIIKTTFEEWDMKNPAPNRPVFSSLDAEPLFIDAHESQPQRFYTWKRNLCNDITRQTALPVGLRERAGGQVFVLDEAFECKHASFSQTDERIPLRIRERAAHAELKKLTPANDDSAKYQILAYAHDKNGFESVKREVSKAIESQSTGYIEYCVRNGYYAYLVSLSTNPYILSKEIKGAARKQVRNACEAAVSFAIRTGRTENLRAISTDEQVDPEIRAWAQGFVRQAQVQSVENCKTRNDLQGILFTVTQRDFPQDLKLHAYEWLLEQYSKRGDFEAVAKLDLTRSGIRDAEPLKERYSYLAKRTFIQTAKERHDMQLEEKLGKLHGLIKGGLPEELTDVVPLAQATFEALAKEWIIWPAIRLEGESDWRLEQTVFAYLQAKELPPAVRIDMGQTMLTQTTNYERLVKLIQLHVLEPLALEIWEKIKGQATLREGGWHFQEIALDEKIPVPVRAKALEEYLKGNYRDRLQLIGQIIKSGDMTLSEIAGEYVQEVVWARLAKIRYSVQIRGIATELEAVDPAKALTAERLELEQIALRKVKEDIQGNNIGALVDVAQCNVFPAQARRCAQYALQSAGLTKIDLTPSTLTPPKRMPMHTRPRAITLGAC